MSAHARVRRFAPLLLAFVVIVGTFVVVLPRFADYSGVADAISGMSKLAVFGLVVTGAINILTFAPNWMAALPGIDFKR